VDIHHLLEPLYVVDMLTMVPSRVDRSVTVNRPGSSGWLHRTFMQSVVITVNIWVRLWVWLLLITLITPQFAVSSHISEIVENLFYNLA